MTGEENEDSQVQAAATVASTLGKLTIDTEDNTEAGPAAEPVASAHIDELISGEVAPANKRTTALPEAPPSSTGPTPTGGKPVSTKQGRKGKGRRRRGNDDSVNVNGVEEWNDQYSTRNLYIRGLGQDTTDATLHSMFAPFGDIVSAKAVMDRDIPTQCKGFGFVMFRLQESAQQAVIELSSAGHSVQYAKVSPRRSSSGSSQLAVDPTNLYFSNLPLDYTEEKLEELLAPFGKVISRRILKDSTTQASRGVGFARMKDHAVCENIVKSLSGIKLEEDGEPLQCKFADSPTHRYDRKSRSNDRHLAMEGPLQPFYVPQHSGVMPYNPGMYYGLPLVGDSTSTHSLEARMDAPSPIPLPYQAPVQFVPPTPNGLFVPPGMMVPATMIGQYGYPAVNESQMAADSLK